jgi:DNA-binding IclR family transcriptional regulator
MDIKSFASALLPIDMPNDTTRKPLAHDKKAHEHVRAADRALDILLAFRPGEVELTVAELLPRVNLSRPTLYRMLHTLVQSGFLAVSDEPQRFRFGSAIAQLVHVWLAGHDIAQQAQPMLRALREETRETAAVFVPDSPYRVCAAELESPQPLNFRLGVGYREKLALGASGHAILSRMSLSAAELADLAAGTRQDPARLRADLQAVRDQGYAISDHALIEGAIAIAAPFFNGANQVAGALCIFGPSVRLTPSKSAHFGPLLVREAARLSRALGQAGEP